MMTGEEDGGAENGAVVVFLCFSCTHMEAREPEASVVINYNLCGQKGQEGHVIEKQIGQRKADQDPLYHDWNEDFF